MEMTYTIHIETDDCTLHPAVATVSTKTEAKRVAGLIAKNSPNDVLAVVVMSDGVTIWEVKP
jgi:hypothetical protein